MHTCKLILAFAILTALAPKADAGDKLKDPTKRLTAADGEKLVEQLANPNKPPFEDDYVLDLPKGQGESELLKSFNKIEEAYNTLSKNIEVALPILMKHIKDKRYSFVEEQPGSGVYRKQSVGYACAVITYAHVEAHLKYTFCHDGEGRPRSYSFLSHCGGLDKWWETRKNKDLADLQLEAMDWVLKQEKPRQFKTENEWQTALVQVKKMADTIRMTKKPIVVDHKVFFFSK